MPSGAVAQVRDRFDPATRAMLNEARAELSQAWAILSGELIAQAEARLRVICGWDNDHNDAGGGRDQEQAS